MFCVKQKHHQQQQSISLKVTLRELFFRKPGAFPCHIISSTWTYLLTFAPSEESDQPAHSRSLIRIFTGHILDSQGAVFSCRQWRFRPDCTDVPADLSPRCAYFRRYVFWRCGQYSYGFRFFIHALLNYIYTRVTSNTLEYMVGNIVFESLTLVHLKLFWYIVFVLNIFCQPAYTILRNNKEEIYLKIFITKLRKFFCV